MLDPRQRGLLFDALRPPEGHTLDCAVGTTFTLDLLALLTVPVAFTMFEADDHRQLLQRGSLALLESLRRYADRMTVFCHAGEIKVPFAQFPHLAYLEGMVVEARPAARGAVFHPKLWLLRFNGPDNLITYRLVCLTRNLTFDHCWDTVLTLDGPLRDRATVISANRPLQEFVTALPTLATRPLTVETRARLRLIADEVGRVAFEPPEGIDSVHFHTLGTGKRGPLPFERVDGRMLVISPFVSRDGLQALVKGRSDCVVVSRPDSLAALESLPAEISRSLVLHEQTATAEPEVAPLQRGLHAKCYVVDSGSKASVWTGSANATWGAFNGNVEFLVELVGPKSRLGIDTLIEPRRDESSLADILQPFVQPKVAVVPPEPSGLRAAIDGVRDSLARSPLSARAEANPGTDTFRLTLLGFDARATSTANVTVTCWPATLGKGFHRTITGASPVIFEALSLESLTAFFAFEVRASDSVAGTLTDSFVLNAPLHGAPADRPERLVRALVSDRESFLRYLLLLLADDGAELAGAMAGTMAADPMAGSAPQVDGDTALLESLLRTLTRDPTRLDHLARLVSDIREQDPATAVFPAGFAAIWDPIWAARQGSAP